MRHSMSASIAVQRGDIIDTLARVEFERGHLEKAIELEEKAVKNAPDEQMKKELQATLEKYKAKRTA